MSTSTAVTFSTFSHCGDEQLAISRYRVAGNARAPHVMFCGGFHSTMQGTKAAALMVLCQTRGWHFTRFDYRGHGQSTGKASGFTLADWLDDTLAVLDQQQLPTILVGSSMGAWLATLASLRRPELVEAIVLLAAAPDFVQELVVPNLSVAQVWDLQQGQIIELPTQYDSTHPVTQALVDSATDLSLLASDCVSHLHCPARLVHGTADTDVPFDLSVRLMGKMPPQHDARLSLLHDTDHRLSDEASLAYIQDELSALVEHLHGES